MRSFEELGVAPNILKAIKEQGYEYPMPVQEEVIPILLDKKRDIVALAQTGTGKTAAFGLPLIQHIETDKKITQALIMAPTRELCVQIANDLIDYAKYIENLHVLPVYGGANIDAQIKALKNGVQIIVATPGRLIDLIKRKAVKLAQVDTVILDEADEMLRMGFIESIDEILAAIPENRNTMLFSATMPHEIARISKKYMNEPVEITIGKKNQGSENIKHIYYVVHAKDKYAALKRIADFHPNIYSIVFCRTRRETQEIAEKLINDGYNAEALHGDLSQMQRDTIMQKFRLKNVRILVATDVAARGLDVDNLTHVINYSLPDDSEIYNHRSGRTGRAGKTGVSIAIINMREKHLIKRVEQSINKKFEQGKIPGGKEICEKRLFNMIDKMENVEVDHSQINEFLPTIFRKLEWLDKEDIIKRFVSLEFNRFLDYYKNAQDLSIPDEKSERNNKKDRSSRQKNSGTEEGYSRIFINLGKNDGLQPASLIDLINENTYGEKVPVGKIDIMPKFSFFEVDADYTDTIIRALKNQQYRNTRIGVEVAKPKSKEESFSRPNKDRSFDKKDSRRKNDDKPYSFKKDKGRDNNSSDRKEKRRRR